ncbi:TraR/DksA C4-type zinc finger protein [bacterium]|nr:TraR/DksA C4-type zinc finger protein [bacterium]
MLSEKFIEKQKERLLKQKKELEDQLKDLRAKRRRGRRFWVRFPNYGRDVDADVQEVQDYSENLSLERRLSELLRDTKLALKLIRKKKYGICIVCGKPIPKQRLEAYPAALTHAQCKKPPRFWEKIWSLARFRRKGK